MSSTHSGLFEPGFQPIILEPGHISLGIRSLGYSIYRFGAGSPFGGGTVIPVVFNITSAPTGVEIAQMATVFFLCRIIVEYGFRRGWDVGTYHTANLYWQSIPFWIEQTRALGIPLGHVLEGYFEADWKPVKKFFREHSNYHDTERDFMSFRAFQEAHSVAVTQYGIPNTSGVSVPPTDMLNLLICPCVTACSLFVSNERLWCQHLKNCGADKYVDGSWPDSRPPPSNAGAFFALPRRYTRHFNWKSGAF